MSYLCLYVKFLLFPSYCLGKKKKKKKKKYMAHNIIKHMEVSNLHDYKLCPFIRYCYIVVPMMKAEVI